MDTLYIMDIPSDFHFAQFGSDYITLYNEPSGHNETLHYYRVYSSNLGYYYSQGDTTFSQYNTTYFTDIPVSNDWMYRHDIDIIFVVCLCIFIMFLFVWNIITSCFKKGGVFGGLF